MAILKLFSSIQQHFNNNAKDPDDIDDWIIIGAEPDAWLDIEFKLKKNHNVEIYLGVDDARHLYNYIKVFLYESKQTKKIKNKRAKRGGPIK